MSVLDKIKKRKKQRDQINEKESQEAVGAGWLLRIARDAMANQVNAKELQESVEKGAMSGKELAQLLLQKCDNEDVCKDIAVIKELMDGKDIAQDSIEDSENPD